MLKFGLIISVSILVIVLTAMHLHQVHINFSTQLAEDTEQEETLHVFTSMELISTGQQGHKESQISSPETRYQAHLNRTTLESPTMLVYREKSSPVKLTADTAVVDHSKDITTLKNNVEVLIEKNKSKQIRMITDSLDIDNTNRTALTETSATVFYGNSTIQGKGMELELQTEQIRFLNNVRGSYER